MIVPAYVLVTPLSFGLAMIFDAKAFAADVRQLPQRMCEKLQNVKQRLHPAK